MGAMHGRLAYPLVASLIFAGCGDDPAGPGGAGSDGAGGAGSSGGGAQLGGGGAGGGAPLEPRSITIAYRSYRTPDPDTLMVLINHVDGSLVTTLKGSELPTQATVVDGDIVTYVYRSGSSLDAELNQQIQSYRVTPGVDGFDIPGWLWLDFSGAPSCVSEKMHVTIHLPTIAGATHARAWFENGPPLALDALPGDLVGDVRTCGLEGMTAPVLVTLSAANGAFVAFEMIEDVLFEPGTSVELSPSLASSPRAALQFEVDSTEPVLDAWGDGYWRGDSDPFAGEPFLFLPYEPPAQVALGPVPLTFTTTPPDLPHGQPMGLVKLDFMPDAGACHRLAEIVRRGVSATSIAFHADALAEPIEDATGYHLGTGERGDWVYRVTHSGATVWSSYEDPAQEPFPLVPPTLPDTLPPGFVRPTEAFVPVFLGHDEDDTVNGYADAFRTFRSSSLPSTWRHRGRLYDCL